APPKASDSSLRIGRVTIRGLQNGPLRASKDHLTYSNGTDTFYLTNMADGGVFVLYRYSPSTPTITTNPYPELSIPGARVRYVMPTSSRPFYGVATATPPFSFARP